LEKEREDLKSAEEFCLFAMRMNKHLKDARLDKNKPEVQARRVAMFLCGTALIKWESEALLFKTL